MFQAVHDVGHGEVAPLTSAGPLGAAAVNKPLTSVLNMAESVVTISWWW